MKYILFFILIFSIFLVACSPSTIHQERVCTDDECFFIAVDSCEQIFYQRDSVTDFFGVEIRSVVDIKILEYCTIDVTLRDFSLSPSDYMDDIYGDLSVSVEEQDVINDDMYALVNEQVKDAFGLSARCDFRGEEITSEFLGIFFMDSEHCSGDLVTFFLDDFT